jgi:purine/pyrimidine-nucleoside phosphorylase
MAARGFSGRYSPEAYWANSPPALREVKLISRADFKWGTFLPLVSSRRLSEGRHSQGRNGLEPTTAMPADSFSSVTVHTKANVYFEGRVVSHTVLFPSGEKKTLGLIYPGEYHFGTAAQELMEIVAGECTVVLDGQDTKAAYGAGTQFEVPGNSGFTIKVTSGICEYICSFLS